MAQLTFGQRLKHARVARGLSQSAVAAPVLTKAFVSLLEHDGARPSLATLTHLTERLGRPFEYFLDGLDAKTVARTLAALDERAQAALAQRRMAAAALPAMPRPHTDGGIADEFDARLPFTLTAGQVAVGQTIANDLACAYPMHRLLQGEVGSGKTVIAMRAMLQVVDAGGQAALLAPTEVLAQQHHRSVTDMLGPLAQRGQLGAADHATGVALLTGSVGAAARRSALEESAASAIRTGCVQGRCHMIAAGCRLPGARCSPWPRTNRSPDARRGRRLSGAQWRVSCRASVCRTRSMRLPACRRTGSPRC